MTKMIEVKTADLTGPALDWAVAKALGWTNYPSDSIEQGDTWHMDPGTAPFGPVMKAAGWRPSTNWSQGGPLIDGLNGFELKIWMQSRPNLKCEAHIHNLDGDWIAFGHTPLIAAMRCLVASKLGDTVQAPEELQP